MGLTDYYLCCAFYASIPLDTPWVNPLWKLSLQYAAEMGLNVTHFEYDIYGNIDWKNQRVYRHIKRNQSKLSLIQPKILRSLTFYSVGEDGDYLLAPFSCCMLSLDVEQTRDKMIYFQFRHDYINKLSPNSMQFEHLLRNVSIVAIPGYGFVHPIKGNKHPICFCYGMPTSVNLNQEEESDAKIWDHLRNTYRNKVRNIYWGNIITKSHWGDDSSKGRSLFSQLKTACSGQITWNGDNMMFFHCPIDIFKLDSNPDEFENWRKTIRGILTQYSIEVLVPEI